MRVIPALVALLAAVARPFRRAPKKLVRKMALAEQPTRRGRGVRGRSRGRGGTVRRLVSYGRGGPVYEDVPGPDGKRYAAWKGDRAARYVERFAIGGTADERRLMRNARKRERAR